MTDETVTGRTMRMIRNEIIEECAKAADNVAKEWSEDADTYAVKGNFHRANVSLNYKNGAEECALAIRALALPPSERANNIEQERQ